MATLQTLINNIDYFYEITKIPMFILNKNKIIDHYPQFFFHLPKDCFKYLINSSMTRWGKVGILSSKSDITFFIIYEEYTICFGPMLCNSLHRYQSPKEIVFFNHLIKKPSINDILKKCISFDNQKFTYIQLIYQFLFNDYLSIEDMRCILHDNKKSEAEEEVKEIRDGVVEIKSIAREAGSRTKIAVWSNNPNVDAVGACVGMNGSRVNAIVDELRGEKIDIVNWDENPGNLIQNALSPAKIVAVFADPDERTAKVVVPDYQLSLAIGKEGQNARLAARLTGYKIDIKSETQAKDAPGFRYEDYLDDGYDDEEEEYEDDYEEGAEEALEDTQEPAAAEEDGEGSDE